MATLTRGITYGSSESITNTKLHTLVDSGTCTAIVNADVSAGAAIAYSKLALTGSISNSDINSSAAIAYSKLALSASITRTDIATGYGLVPSGAILMWSGTIATIPTGWYLCNGSNSTPDLRNLFIVGADADSGGAAKSTITGSALQTHTTGIVGTHVHPVKTSNTTGGATTYVRVGVAATQDTSQDTDANTGANAKNIAPFYALAFIMKS